MTPNVTKSFSVVYTLLELLAAEALPPALLFLHYEKVELLFLFAN